MKWHKVGNIFTPEKHLVNKGLSFGAVPLVGAIHNNLVDIYFTVRNNLNQSLFFKAVFDFDDNYRIVDLTTRSLLELGEPGTFDENGVMACQFININGEEFIYYQGWNIAQTVPFRNAIGLARYNTKNSMFEKISSGPILDRSIYDPCFVATPFVLQEAKNRFLMYYLSCDRWIKIQGGVLHQYNIKIAHSTNGIDWSRNGEIAIDYANEYEYAFSVPRVIKEDGIYKMWYSYRGGKGHLTYRLGYAESDDGIKWERKDELIGIDVSAQGWDSEMISYPYVFDYLNKRYLLYNGNNYGASGFGLAIWEN
ncbi:MAG: hypothetical protein COW03_09315 [Cytophagales bacterium CG12_big_fil_rev_8_21_14_0_65_40_12]|nr:MAG: hypothetical protein COW03_09315 [Cytophagales bacterium CG12_big_fil_rev_8_21_14_0_65_40_12]PIW02789.1 MAG: hypothetical protein COW40_18215 [Cytophagales bacterium CG17_big_fil_post_rev_8_21_14_2_50_40_13]